VFNNAPMEHSPTHEKLSSTKSIGFRPGALRGKVDTLYTELLRHDSGLKLSDIIRDGVTAFWPQIEAYLRARQQTHIDPVALAQLTIVCAKAIEHGVTPAQLEEQLDTLIERRLSA
jgi:hypothetical protein